MRTSFFVKGTKVWEVESADVMTSDQLDEIIEFCNAAELGEVNGIFLEVGVDPSGGTEQ